MTKKMLKFIDVEQETPEKRNTNKRKGDFNEIYKDYITKCTEINYIPLSSSKHKENIPLLHDLHLHIVRRCKHKYRLYYKNHLM